MRILYARCHVQPGTPSGPHRPAGGPVLHRHPRAAAGRPHRPAAQHPRLCDFVHLQPHGNLPVLCRHLPPGANAVPRRRGGVCPLLRRLCHPPGRGGGGTPDAGGGGSALPGMGRGPDFGPGQAGHHPVPGGGSRPPHAGNSVPLRHLRREGDSLHRAPDLPAHLGGQPGGGPAAPAPGQPGGKTGHRHRQRGDGQAVRPAAPRGRVPGDGDPAHLPPRGDRGPLGVRGPALRPPLGAAGRGGHSGLRHRQPPLHHYGGTAGIGGPAAPGDGGFGHSPGH